MGEKGGKGDGRNLLFEHGQFADISFILPSDENSILETSKRLTVVK